MTIDIAALRGDRSSQTVPDDGLHVARLERVALYESDKGEKLITEWSDDQNVQWTSWNQLYAGGGLPYTQDLLDGLGVDRSKLTEDGFLDEVEKHVGSTYEVRTQSNQGRDGVRWFTSTYIEQPIAGRQESLEDIPADTAGLPERDAAPVGGDIFGDDAPF